MKSHAHITFYKNNRNIMSDILHAITTIILCNSLDEKIKIFSKQLINKKKMIFCHSGKDHCFCWACQYKNGTGEIVVKGTKYLSPNKFYGHTKHSSNAKYTRVYIL